MFATGLIVFREVLEAALIIGIVMAATRGVVRRGIWVNAGVGAGLAGAALVAAFADVIASALAGVGQELFNAAVLFSAVVMLGWHNVWMKRHGREMAQQMNNVGRDVLSGKRPLYMLAVVVGLAVLREGSEVVLFLYGIIASQESAPLAMLSGGLLGLGTGAGLGVAMYFGLMRIPMRHLFTVTAWLILLLAAGLAAQGAGYLVQAGYLPPLGTAVWDTSSILSEQSVPGQILHILIGYMARPDGIQVLFYFITFTLIGGLMRLVGKQIKPGPSVTRAAVSVCGVIALAAALFSVPPVTQASAMPTQQAVLEHYADLAQTMYQDSLATAKVLQKAVDKLIEQPTEKNLAAARAAWKAARVPYQQTEAYRFGNSIVDDWEGNINAWPLDEGLIDYVDAGYGKESDVNPFYTANVVANKMLMVGGKHIDASKITKEVIGSLQEAGGIETNVAVGYHAIEFLLWGQDLNGTGPGAGVRLATDYDTKNCTHGNCDRRAAYLKAATDFLVDELDWMTQQWATGGEARNAVIDGGAQGLATILTGMGSLSYGELAGERMKLGLMLHDPEEEHDCFSDNTHNSHFYDVMGIKDVYTGTYIRVDGSRIAGPSISDLVAVKSPDTDKALRKGLDATLAKMQVLVDSAEKNGVHYDQLIGEGNKEGNAMVLAAVEALLDQAKLIEKAVVTLDLTSIEFEGSDSLDNPEKVGQ